MVPKPKESSPDPDAAKAGVRSMGRLVVLTGRSLRRSGTRGPVRATLSLSAVAGGCLGDSDTSTFKTIPAGQFNRLYKQLTGGVFSMLIRQFNHVPPHFTEVDQTITLLNEEKEPGFTGSGFPV